MHLYATLIPDRSRAHHRGVTSAHAEPKGIESRENEILCLRTVTRIVKCWKLCLRKTWKTCCLLFRILTLSDSITQFSHVFTITVPCSAKARTPKQTGNWKSPVSKTTRPIWHDRHSSKLSSVLSTAEEKVSQKTMQTYTVYSTCWCIMLQWFLLLLEVSWDRSKWLEGFRAHPTRGLMMFLLSFSVVARCCK